MSSLLVENKRREQSAPNSLIASYFFVTVCVKDQISDSPWSQQKSSQSELAERDEPTRSRARFPGGAAEGPGVERVCLCVYPPPQSLSAWDTQKTPLFGFKGLETASGAMGPSLSPFCFPYWATLLRRMLQCPEERRRRRGYPYHFSTARWNNYILKCVECGCWNCLYEWGDVKGGGGAVIWGARAAGLSRARSGWDRRLAC